MPSDQHDRRRDEILTTAQGLFFSKGYENTSISEIIDTIGIAKGTFYHYFASKESLLSELVERITDALMDEVAAIAAQPDRSPTDRLAEYFSHALSFKVAQRELLVPAITVLYQPANLVLLSHLTEHGYQRSAPILAQLITEGVAAGEFDVEDPELCGDFLIRSLGTFSPRIAEMVISNPDAPDLWHRLERIYRFMEWNVARVLGLRGAPPQLIDRGVARRLFDPTFTHSEAHA